MKNGLLKNLYIFGRIQYDDKVIPGFYGLFFVLPYLQPKLQNTGFYRSNATGFSTLSWEA
jgi:hypothetical protein